MGKSCRKLNIENGVLGWEMGTIGKVGKGWRVARQFLG